MKKMLVLLACMLVLNGCSQVETIKKKIPYLNKEENQAKEDKNVETDEETNAPQTPTTPATNEGLVLDSIFFNEVKQVDGKNIIQNPENILALVNKNAGLPATYTPQDLVRPEVLFAFGAEKLEKSLIRKEAALSLEKMFLTAKQAGIELIAVSGYRSFDRQKILLDAEIGKVGQEKAIQAVANPGQSEHQTGLAMDIASKSSNLQLTEAFATTKEGQWLASNAHKYGFTLRYPKGKEEITGYQFEPWHFRYVGIPTAEILYNKKWTLEEYFNEVRKI